MIQEVDAALEALVRRDAMNGSRVDVLFDAPTKDWVARRNAPSVDLYLYDIREDLPRRQVQLQPVRNAETGFISAHRMPTRRFRLSYLVTAWTQRPEDEHRLLASLLATFVHNEIIPRDLTSGSLSESEYPVLLTVCLPPPQDRTIADVWSALGGELKPSLDLVATAPLDPLWSEPAGAPVLEQPQIGVGGPATSIDAQLARDERLARGGHRRSWRVPLGPGVEAVQDEIIGGARSRTTIAPAAGADTTASPAGAAATRRGKRRPGDDADAAAEETDVAVGSATTPATSRRSATPDASAAASAAGVGAAGGGRIVRVRGISRP